MEKFKAAGGRIRELAPNSEAEPMKYAFDELKQPSVVAITNLENLSEKITGQDVPLNYYQMENPNQ